ncbi:MAG: hypothetical protein COA58_09790 [Bacteroidetes bacterium]|nr:MAG: hypothetical protein COA58_09790 [Bacteroidota bacterium]
MLYQLQKLSEEEQTLVQRSPIWVTLLIACADHDIEEAEIDRAKEVIYIKSFAVKNDVKNLYKNLDSHVDQEIDDALKTLSAKGGERLEFLETHLAKLNDIFPKLDRTYAVQLYNSLTSLAVSVAQSDGGIFGIGRINNDEKKYIHLPMLQKP